MSTSVPPLPDDPGAGDNDAATSGSGPRVRLFLPPTTYTLATEKSATEVAAELVTAMQQGQVVQHSLRGGGSVIVNASRVEHVVVADGSFDVNGHPGVNNTTG